MIKKNLTEPGSITSKKLRYIPSSEKAVDDYDNKSR